MVVYSGEHGLLVHVHVKQGDSGLWSQGPFKFPMERFSGYRLFFSPQKTIMASLCRLRVLSSLKNFARIQHIQGIATRSTSFAVLQQSLGTWKCKQNNLQQRITELTRTVRHYGSAAEMTIASIQERCTLVLKLFDKVDPDKVTLEAKFAEDLGLDSLDAVEIIMAMEDEFGVEIPDDTAEKLLNLKDVVECLADRLDVAH